MRLIEIDDLLRTDHYHLEEGDECYCFGEYTSDKGYTYSNVNQLIINIKHAPRSRSGMIYWKNRDIARAARMVNELQFVDDAIVVPVPPSKTKSDADYDDRLLRILEPLKGKVYELVYQTESYEPSHRAEDRITTRELIDIYHFDDVVADTLNSDPAHILIFDDVLTAGCHFKAMQSILAGHYPGANIVGLFIARRVFAEDD